MKYIELKVVASVPDLADLLVLLGVIQHLGEIGASRVIPLHVDGDGSARFTFYMNGEKINSIKVDASKKELPDIWLGE